ncbi:hypothetical protein D3C73_1483820 [compost metagenome]
MRHAMHRERAVAVFNGANGPGVMKMRRVPISEQVRDQHVAGQARAAMPNVLGNRHGIAKKTQYGR